PMTVNRPNVRARDRYWTGWVSPAATANVGAGDVVLRNRIAMTSRKASSVERTRSSRKQVPPPVRAKRNEHETIPLPHARKKTRPRDRWGSGWTGCRNYVYRPPWHRSKSSTPPTGAKNSVARRGTNPQE